jgi:ribosomal protein S18 acetylase RimI-like enzyme
MNDDAGRHGAPPATLVRDADAGDETVIVRLVNQMGVGLHFPTSIDEAFVPRYLAQPAATILLAFQGEQAVGLLALSTRLDLFHAAPIGEIEDLIVTAKARGSGVGELLMRTAVGRLEQLGCREINVLTARDNDAAQRLYRKAGLNDELVCLRRHFADRSQI